MAYEAAAFLQSACVNCGAMVGQLCPTILEGDSSLVILALRPGMNAQLSKVELLVSDLVSTLPHAITHVYLYANVDHYLLHLEQIDLFHDLPVDSIAIRNIGEVQTHMEDISNDLLQIDKPIVALELCCQILSLAPDVRRSASLVENLEFMAYIAKRRGHNPEVIDKYLEFLRAEFTDHANEAQIQILWRVPYAFGPEAPVLEGVPAGYMVPDAYLIQEELSDDERAEIYLRLLLLSSTYTRAVKVESPSWVGMRHHMLLDKVKRYWSKASVECRQRIEAYYGTMSQGGSLIAALRLNESE